MWEPPWFLLFLLNRRLTRTVPCIIFFSKAKKIWFSSLTVLNNSRTSQFSWLVLTSWISEISMYFFENYYYYYIIVFWDKIIDIEGVGKLRCTQFDTNLELHIISKVVTRKISLTLNNFKIKYKWFGASKLKEVTRIMNMKLRYNFTFL